MPMYVVRWPDLTAALVSATDEDDLMDILDQVADPTGCIWSPYRGPVFLEFHLKAELNVERKDGQSDRPLERSEMRIGDVSAICERDTLAAVIPAADAASDMKEAITRFAFPAVHAALEIAEVDPEVAEADVRAAVDKDLDLLLRASWQQQQTARRPDEVSQIAAAMGTSPRVIERIRAQLKTAGPAPTPPTPSPSKRGKKPPSRRTKRPPR